MTAQEFEQMLTGALEVASDEDEFPVQSFGNFEDAGLLTRDNGLLVYMQDGSEFQLTIVKTA